MFALAKIMPSVWQLADALVICEVRATEARIAAMAVGSTHWHVDEAVSLVASAWLASSRACHRLRASKTISASNINEN